MTFRPAFALFLLAAGTLLLAQAAPQAPPDASQKAIIEGKVVSSTGAPLAKATVRLSRMGAAAAANSGAPLVPTILTANTGADGLFHFDGVDPGRYTLLAQVRHGAEGFGYFRDVDQAKLLRINKGFPKQRCSADLLS